LNLTTSTTATTDATATTPWWQTLADVSWKLGVVLILIWLMMRGLQALKKRGGTAKGDAQSFFEKLDELSLGPNLTLLAVRAGGRVLLLARSASGVQTLGELEDAGNDAGEEPPAAPQRALPSSFTNQLWRAWAKLSGPSADVGGEAETSGSDAAPPADVVDARWVHVPGDAPGATVTEMGALPLRRGVARDGDQPEPLSPAREREILWHAETNGDAAAAKKYGLTRQRVTAMRLRRDREQPDHALTEGPPPHAVTRMPTPVEHPVVPDGQTAPEPISLAAARQSVARSAYRAASDRPRATADAETSRAATVGQILASRFGVNKSGGKAAK
jgi:flagellar biogenesis protein FliO